MSSINAKRVAKDVSENLRKGKRVNMGKILRKNGYSKQTSLKPKVVTSTKSYQEEIAPIVKAMIRERDAIMKRLPKVRGKAKYRDLVDASEKMTKQIQLLTGGKTEDLGLDQLTKELKTLIASVGKKKK